MGLGHVGSFYFCFVLNTYFETGSLTLWPLLTWNLQCRDYTSWVLELKARATYSRLYSDFIEQLLWAKRSKISVPRLLWLHIEIVLHYSMINIKVIYNEEKGEQDRYREFLYFQSVLGVCFSVLLEWKWIISGLGQLWECTRHCTTPN